MRSGCGTKRRRIVANEADAKNAAIAASFAHGGEHRAERCGNHWHVTRVTNGAPTA